jgi:eight-cysteine-cluster-containing protein
MLMAAEKQGVLKKPASISLRLFLAAILVAALLILLLVALMTLSGESPGLPGYEGAVVTWLYTDPSCSVGTCTEEIVVYADGKVTYMNVSLPATDYHTVQLLNLDVQQLIRVFETNAFFFFEDSYNCTPSEGCIPGPGTTTYTYRRGPDQKSVEVQEGYRDDRAIFEIESALADIKSKFLAAQECWSDNGCVTGGCSSQICGASGVADDVITTCEWLEAYACLPQAGCKCIDNRCVWSKEAAAYQDCLSDIL